MADWFEPTLILFPFAAWMFWGVGIPWALALLPRGLWRERITVIAIGMALGPLFVTAWMFVLGTFARITPGATLAGSLVIALIGAGMAWRRLRVHPFLNPSPHAERDLKLPFLRVRGKGPGDRGYSLILLGMILLLAANVIVTAYWPFIEYDTQWVYGYNARIFVTRQQIPDDMAYYPQLIPLGYTHMQQAWDWFRDPAINDHAARVIVPWFNVASVLMAYVLGLLAFQRRRVALLTAAVWAFYPHMAARGGAGDLEIPLTLYMTGAAACFIPAWRNLDARLAVISGLMLAGALWTKPTGGALALGVMLYVIFYAVHRVRKAFTTEDTERTEEKQDKSWNRRGAENNKRRYRASDSFSSFLRVLGVLRGEKFVSKLRIALIVALACAPLGAMWYARNALLGHTAVVFPADYWHNFAQRSGQEFGWPLLIASLAAGGLMVHHRRHGDDQETSRRISRIRVPLAGRGSPLSMGWRGDLGVRLVRRVRRVRFIPLLALILLLLGILPTALNPDAITEGDNLWRWARGDLFAARRLNPLEAGLIVAGFALLIAAGRSTWKPWPHDRREAVLMILALMLPYAVVWFFNFSYHYRLSFAIVPFAAALVAALIDGWLWGWLAASRAGRAAGVLIIVAAVGVALAAALEHTVEAWRDGGLPDDTAKYDRGNPALMVVVHALEAYAAEHGEPVVSIPGEDRLPFFFLDWDIRNSGDPDEIPTSVEDLGDADIYIENSRGTFLMQRYGLWPNSLSAEAALGATYYDIGASDGQGDPWPTVLQPIPIGLWGGVPTDDGNFRYSMFTIHPEARQTPMKPGGLRKDTVIFGDFAQFIGHDMVSLNWVRGERIILTLYWRPTDQAPPPRDYSVYIHLLTPEGDLIAQWDGGPLQGTYSTRFWRPGESLLDFWKFVVPKDAQKGPAHLRIGLYDPLSSERLPVTINGEPAGDGLTIETRIKVP